MSRIIMGVDPGTNVLGYALIEVNGKQLSLLVMGVIEMQQLETHYDKLAKIFERISALVKEYQPAELAIEAPFFGVNVQSMLKLGRAQGVAMAAALAQGVPIFEYAPKKIKTAITGSGAASKEQVARMLKIELKLDDTIHMLDATDALGAAVCHYHQTRNAQTAGLAAGNWADFIKQNPNRVAGKSTKRP